MHPYSTNSEERSRVPFFVALIAILLAWLIAALLKQIQLPFWLEVPGAFGLYGLLLAAFRSHLWRCRVFRALGVVKVPDLGGEWRGHVTSSFDAAADQHPVAVRIRQNWTHMAIHLTAGGSRSYSVVASLYVAEDETVLGYQYINEPNVRATETMHAHNGTASLSVTDDNSRLAGDYYSGRDRNNYGHLALERRRGTPTQNT